MFIELAYQGKNNFWLYVLSIILILFCLFLGSLPMIFALVIAQVTHPGAAVPDNPMDMTVYGIDSNTSLAYGLFSFVIGLVGVLIAVRFIHRRKVVTVLTARPKLDLRRVFFGAGVWLALTLGAEFVFYLLYPSNYVFQFDPARFLPLFVVSILLIPFQTSFEEVFMRGYLLQGFGVLTRYRWIPVLLVSLVFGILHVSNSEVSKYGFFLTMPFYFTFGLFAAVITIVDDGLEIPLGMHAINNLYSALIVTFPSSTFPTPALIQNKEYLPVGMLVSWFVTATMFIFILHKKYRWTDWKRFWSCVQKPIPENVPSA